MRTETDQLFIDIFTTALEGGIGYWSECLSYHWTLPDGDGEEDYDGFRAGIVELYELEDPDDDDSGIRHAIDREVIARGYNLAITSHREKIHWSTARPPYVVTEESREDWGFDAGDADAIVQLGLFGEVRYG